MAGIILIVCAALFLEAATVIGKVEVKKKRESLYTMGFLNLFLGTLCLGALGIFRGSDFHFVAASLPTFTARIFLEIVQLRVALGAITVADRTTYSFVRVGTIPLLLLVDLALGYTITLSAMTGIALVTVALALLFSNHHVSRRGLGLTIVSAVNAVATLSLFKYNITHFNSVEAEQGLIQIILLIYCFVQARVVAHENPFRFLRQPVFFAQSLLSGLGGAAAGFAYLFAPASIITAAERSGSVLWAFAFGGWYFREHGLVAKAAICALLIIGIVLLVV
jgi:hypothetical protein